MTTTTSATAEELCNEERARELLGGIGHTKYYALLRPKEGQPAELRSVQIGRRRFVPRSEIDRFIASLVT